MVAGKRRVAGARTGDHLGQPLEDTPGLVARGCCGLGPTADAGRQDRGSSARREEAGATSQHRADVPDSVANANAGALFGFIRQTQNLRRKLTKPFRGRGAPFCTFHSPDGLFGADLNTPRPTLALGAMSVRVTIPE